MKKIIIVLAICLTTIYTISLVNQRNSDVNLVKETTKSTEETWNKLINTEWSNYDDWAGSGLKFFEENNEKKCTFMIYGSGLPVIKEHTSIVTLESDNITINVPNLYDENSKDESVEIIKFTDKQITFMDKIFKNNKNLD